MERKRFQSCLQRKGSKRFLMNSMLTFSVFVRTKMQEGQADFHPEYYAYYSYAEKGLLRNRDFCKEGTTVSRTESMESIMTKVV